VLSNHLLIDDKQEKGLSNGIRASSLYKSEIYFSLLKMLTLNSPPQFNGKNYTYWKVRIRAFLKSVDEKVWLSLDQRWIKPETCFA
jgi:hypothetical protein